MFVLTVNPISSWDLSIFYCPVGSSNSVWTNQTVWSNQTSLPLPHPFLQSTTLDCHISVLGPTILPVIQLEISVICCLFPVLLLSSKEFLIVKDKPKLLNPISKTPHDPIIFSVFHLPTFSLLFSGAKWNCLWFPKHTPHRHTSLSLPSARNAICFCLSKSSLFLRSGSKRHSPVFWSSLKFNEEFTVNYEHCVNKKGCKDSSNKDKCMK